MMSPCRRRRRARSHACAREITNDAVYTETASNCGPAVGLSLQNPRPRSSLTVPTRLGYLPPGVSTSSAQQQEARAVVGAPSHRQHRARFSSLPFPRLSTFAASVPRRSHANPAVKSPNRHEVCDSSHRRLVNQRSNLTHPLPLSPVTKENRRIQSFTPRQCCRQHVGSRST